MTKQKNYGMLFLDHIGRSLEERRYTLNEMFLKLDPQKQKRILDAAYMEFALRGFKNASTNQIVKNAKIGKGMLFYYLNSKEELYYTLIQEAIRKLKSKFFHLVDDSEKDILEKYRQLSLMKMNVYAENSPMMNFLGNLYVLSDKEFIPEGLIEEINEYRKLFYDNFFNKIDLSPIKDDLPKDKVRKLIYWSLEGYQQDLVHKFKTGELTFMDTKIIENEFDAYLNLLKKVFYK